MGLYHQNMTISAISSELLVNLQTKHGLIVQHHKPECPVEKLDYHVQGQGHNEGLKCQLMFVWMIFSESQNILLSNLVW